EGPLGPLPAETGTTLAAELERVRRSPGMVVAVDWHGESSVPADLEPLAQSVLAEALRNIAKHADPSRVEVAVSRDDEDFVLEVRNDGARPVDGEPGMGLRLAAFEALQQGGTVESGPWGGGRWVARLVVPLQQGPEGRPTACACWSSTITTSCTGAFVCCLASSRGSSAFSRRGPARRRWR